MASLTRVVSGPTSERMRRAEPCATSRTSRPCVVRRLTIVALMLAGVAARRLPAQATTTEAARGSGTVTGRAVAIQDSTPVQGAYVYVTGADGHVRRSTLSDERGRFTLRDVPSGSVTVRARRIGLLATLAVVDVPEGGTATLVLRMATQPRRLETVTTTAKATERDQFENAADVGPVTMSRLQLSAVPSVGEPDVLRAVQLMPGVLARNDFSAGYNVRGGEADQNLVLLDGMPLYNPFHLGGLFGTFIDATVSDVSLLTGAFPAAYGGRMSSVLDVTSQTEARQGVHGTLAASLLATSLSLGGALPDARTSWALAGRRTYADAIASAFTDRSVPYHFDDAQGKVVHAFENGAELSLTGYAGGDVLAGSFADLGADTSSNGAGQFGFDWGNQAVGLTLRLPLPHGAVLRIGDKERLGLGDSALFVQRLSATRFATRLDLGEGALTLTNSVREARAGGSLDWRANRHTRTLGYDAAYYLVDYAGGSSVGIQSLALKQKLASGALYFDDTWRASRRLLVRGGARAELVTGVNYRGVSPRASVKFFADDDLAFTLTGGHFTQWLHSVRDEDTPVNIFDFWVASDDKLPVSSADQLSLGAERWWGPRRFIRLESYVKRYDRLPERNNADDPARNGDEFLRATGTSYGADVLLRQVEGGRLAGWVSYSYGVSRRSVGDVGYFPAQDRRHNLNAVASLKQGSRTTYTARIGLGTGTPYTNIIGQVYRRVYNPESGTWDSDAGGVDREPVGGAHNGARYPLFQRLDLGVARRYEWRGAEITPAFQVVNAYNAPNVFVYTFDYTSNPPTRRGISQFPILPTIGVTVAW